MRHRQEKQPFRSKNKTHAYVLLIIFYYITTGHDNIGPFNRPMQTHGSDSADAT